MYDFFFCFVFLYYIRDCFVSGGFSFSDRLSSIGTLSFPHNSTRSHCITVNWRFDEITFTDEIHDKISISACNNTDVVKNVSL